MKGTEEEEEEESVAEPLQSAYNCKSEIIFRLRPRCDAKRYKIYLLLLLLLLVFHSSSSVSVTHVVVHWTDNK